MEKRGGQGEQASWPVTRQPAQFAKTMESVKRRQAPAVVLIAVFAVCTIVPGIAFFFTDKGSGGGEEQRPLAEAPELKLETIDRFPGQFEAYYDDHLPLRSFAVKTQAVLDLTVLGTVDSDRVALGQDDWLYYKDAEDGDPLSAYAFGSQLTEEELREAVRNIETLRDIAVSAGARFYFMLVPNKEEAVPEYLPKGYSKRSDARAMTQLADCLRESTDIPVVDVSSALAAEPRQVFMKYDTHWNALGGFTASQELLAAMGMQPVPLDSLEVRADSQGGGDLAGIAGLTAVLNDDPVWKIYGYKEDIALSGTPMYAPVVRMASDAATGKNLVMYGDSFMEAMMPFLARDFDSSEFILGPPSVAPSQQPALAQQLAELEATDVVLECVERYIPRLVTMDTEP